MKLISTAKLAALPLESVTIIDASYFLPIHGKNGREEYQARHIPGAIFFDIDAIADKNNPLPHMLPDADGFARLVGGLGISDQDQIVVYDQSPLRSAARVWWSLSAFGAKKTAILDGGLQKWIAEGRPVESGAGRSPSPRKFDAVPPGGIIKNKQDMLNIIDDGTAQIIDARPRGRFLGIDPEPRPGMKSGHMPGALNLPFTELFDGNHCYLPEPQLRQKFAEAKIDLTRPIVAHCGSGVTACPVLFAAALCGAKELALYDGSWAEWGAASNSLVEK